MNDWAWFIWQSGKDSGEKCFKNNELAQLWSWSWRENWRAALPFSCHWWQTTGTAGPPSVLSKVIMVPVTFSWSKEPLSMQTLISKGSAEVDSICIRSPPRRGVLLAKKQNDTSYHRVLGWATGWARVIARGHRSNYKTSWIITSLLLILQGKHSFYVRLYSAVLGKNHF